MGKNTSAMVDETFYDSLEDEENPSIRDITESVPLYQGEILKNMIAQRKKKSKVPKPFTPIRPKRTYLTMYYEKLSRRRPSRTDTTRATVCEDSPKSSLDTEMQSPEWDFDEDEFYTKFIELENTKEDKNKEQGPSKDEAKAAREPKQLSKLGLIGQQPPQAEGSRKTDKDKMGLLEKRQNYGMKMTMRNRIKIYEAKALRDIQTGTVAAK